MFYDIISNKVLVIPVCAWAIAQVIKTVVAVVQGRGIDLRLLVRSGGMPSAHSAVVTALATVTGMVQGFGSVSFGITVILAFIVMYDAAGLRQAVSRQSKVLNRIVRELRLGQTRARIESDLWELVGHTPFQVIVGAVMGIVVAWLWIAFTAA